MDRSEIELVGRATRGDPEALGRLLERHAPHLFRIAYALTGRVADAEDVLQESFLAAITALRRFRGDSSVRTFLAGIVARQSALWRRRGSRHGRWVSSERVAAAESAGARLDVHGALAALSEEHREVMVLRELEGMSYDEIAEALGVPRGTVESRIFRARQQLKGSLADYREGT